MAGGVHTVDKEKFFQAYEEWSKGGLSFAKAAKMAGMSVPTLQKYFLYIIEGRKFPDTLFTESEYHKEYEKRKKRGKRCLRE